MANTNSTAGTVFDAIINKLREEGIQESAGVEVRLVNGQTHFIVSDADPLASRPASEIASLRVAKSASAGC